MNEIKTWLNDLEKGVYKSRDEIVSLFCRNIIPSIKDNPRLQVLVSQWREGYQELNRKLKYLQEIVFINSKDTFNRILEEKRDLSEPINLKIKDIEEILSGDRSRRGYTTWPLYRELYLEVKVLLDMVLKHGMDEFCSLFAIIGKNNRNEQYIINFTFAPDIEKVDAYEKMLASSRYQDPIIVWNNLEKAYHFWNIKDEEIELELSSLHKTNPFHSLVTRSAWEEIANVKKHTQNYEAPFIFTVDLFKKGLRTLMNEIITFTQTQEEKT